jgi:hypothetical protein
MALTVTIGIQSGPVLSSVACKMTRKRRGNVAATSSRVRGCDDLVTAILITDSWGASAAADLGRGRSLRGAVGLASHLRKSGHW